MWFTDRIKGLAFAKHVRRVPIEFSVDRYHCVSALMKLRIATFYFLLLFPALFLAALSWSFVAPDHLYHCWDDAPLVTFMPPFVHPAYSTGQQADYFIWPPILVYALWSLLVTLAILLPLVPLLLYHRASRFYETHGLFSKDPSAHARN